MNGQKPEAVAMAQRIADELATHIADPIERAAALNDLAIAITHQIQAILAPLIQDAKTDRRAMLIEEINEELIFLAWHHLDLAELRFNQVRRLQPAAAQ